MSIGKVFDPGKSSNHSDDYPYSWSEEPYHPPTQKYKMSKVCPGPDGELYMNLVCPVDVSQQPEGTLPDIQSADRAIQFIQQVATSRGQQQNLQPYQPHQPFLLAVGMHKPHIPLKYPKEYLDPLSSVGLAPNPHLPLDMPSVAWNPWTDLRERDDVSALNVSFPWGTIPKEFQRKVRQSYYAATSYMDDQIGRILEELETSGMLDQTIIVFIGDHGWSLGEHQEWSKYSNFEVALQVPFLLSIPNVTDTQCRSEHPVYPHTRALDILNRVDLHANNNRDRDDASRSIAVRLNSSAEVVKEDLQHFNQLVELVDIFPTLVELASFPPVPRCPRHYIPSKPVKLCTEGESLLPIIWRRWPNAQNLRQTYVNDTDGPEIVLYHGMKSGCLKNVRFKFPKKVRPKRRGGKVAFSQYPRPSLSPQENSDKPHLADIRIMGYSVRTTRYRYTEWIDFDHVTCRGNWTQVYDRELYLTGSADPLETVNRASDPQYENTVGKLAKLLKGKFKRIFIK
jgi:iduronate 2-sulfatase